MSTEMTQSPAPRASAWMFLAFGLLYHAANQAFAAETPATLSESQQAEFFESKIRPVLIEHCYSCHNSSDNAEGGLAVDHRDSLLQGGDGGILIKSGDPDGSRLLAILRHEIDGLEMPEGGPKLDDSVIADFERWIATGAYDPRDTPPDADSLAAMQSWESLLERRRKHKALSLSDSVFTVCADLQRHYRMVAFAYSLSNELKAASTVRSAFVVQSRHPGRYPKLKSPTLSYPAFEPLTEKELEAVRWSIKRGSPFGNETWVESIARRFGL